MTHIDTLRNAFERLYPSAAKRYGLTPPSMQAFLAIPIEERLILLARYDGADEETIRATLPFAKQTDARLTSARMLAAEATLKHSLEEPTFFIDLGDIPLETDHEGDLVDMSTKTLCRDADIPQSIETTFRWIWYPSAAPLLVGPMVTTELAEWSLRERLIIYCLVVCELTRQEVQGLLGVTDWAVKEVIRKALETIDI